jgi:acetate kinase
MVLVVNPGSASRKYALYSGNQEKASIYYEYVDGKVVSEIEFDGNKITIPCDDTDLSGVSRYVEPLLLENNLISSTGSISAIGIRLVAPSRRFMQDELITSEIEMILEKVQESAPLHITTFLAEVRQLKEHIPNTPIVAVSDSAFHATKPTWAANYGIDTEMADRFDIKRFGYHGISIASVVKKLRDGDILQPKTIVCHLGSGSSVTAVYNGDSYDTTMGYTPLEGLVMASRSGSIDVTAALAIKRRLHFTDNELEHYLNTKCGLLGISGSSNDIRQLLTLEDDGDERASLALKMYVYRIQQAIGQMAAGMGGVDLIVFTGTVGERSFIIRGRIIEELGFLGFKHNHKTNDHAYEPTEPTNISALRKKPIYVVSTNEASEIARRAERYAR